MVVDEYTLMEQQAKQEALRRRKQRMDEMKRSLSRQGLATKLPGAEEKISAEESGLEERSLSDIGLQRARTTREEARIKQAQEFQTSERTARQAFGAGEAEKGRTYGAEQSKLGREFQTSERTAGQDWQSKFRQEGYDWEKQSYDVGGYKYNWQQQQNAWQKDQITFENNLKITNALMEVRAKSLMERASAGETIPDSEIVTDTDRYAIGAGKAAAAKIAQGWARGDAVREAQNKITQEQQKNASDLQKEHEGGGSYICDAVYDQIGFDNPESDKALLKKFKAYCKARDPEGYHEYMVKAPAYIPGISNRALRVLKLLLVNQVVKLTRKEKMAQAYWLYRITCRVIEFIYHPISFVAKGVA